MTIDEPEPESHKLWPSTRWGMAAARSLALHVLIAKEITDNLALLEIARANLARWSAGETPVPDRITEWQELLKKPWPEVAALITDPGAEGIRLRKSAPFPGILSGEERLQIFDTFKARTAEAEWLAANARGIAAYNQSVESQGTFAAAMPWPDKAPEDAPRSK